MGSRAVTTRTPRGTITAKTATLERNGRVAMRLVFPILDAAEREGASRARVLGDTTLPATGYLVLGPPLGSRGRAPHRARHDLEPRFANARLARDLRRAPAVPTPRASSPATYRIDGPNMRWRFDRASDRLRTVGAAADAVSAAKSRSAISNAKPGTAATPPCHAHASYSSHAARTNARSPVVSR
jgi:hypothetical protein